MDKTMTLAQVHDAIARVRAEDVRSSDLDAWEIGIYAVIQAIKAREAGPVGYVSQKALTDLENGEALNIRLWGSADDFVGEPVEVFTAPPAQPKVEVTDAQTRQFRIASLSAASGGMYLRAVGTYDYDQMQPYKVGAPVNVTVALSQEPQS